MNIIRNEKTIKRNAQIGKITSIVSLAVLGGGMYITFKQPDKVSLALTALLVGFLLSQVGIYFTNRWGRSPRPDEQVDTALKGFNKQYSLYHYITPASHVLVGPAGVWVIITKSISGTITYDSEKGRWKKKGGGLLSIYLKIFAQESIGRPDLEISSETEALQRYLVKQLPDREIPIRATLVFTHPDVDVQVADAPNPTLHAKKLKDYLRKAAKGNPISSNDVEAVQEVLEK
ncbi:MAG: nuclease-related domain-containing protein [Chloroflexota bacterium]|nr:nuclease-related domain-containing protein [Chloroflexota bacterium]